MGSIDRRVPLKIALYVHCYFPLHVYGTEVYVMNLARELAALGHEPSIVSAIFPGEPRQKRFVETYEWDGIPVYSIDKNIIPHRSVGEAYDQPAMRNVHERILRRIAPDVVHVCHLINHSRAVLDVASALGLPCFATLTDFYGFCLNHRLQDVAGGLCPGPNPHRSNCMACHLKASAAHGSRSSKILGSPLIRPLAAPMLAWLGRAQPDQTLGSLKPADIVRRPDRLLDAFRHYRAALAPTSVLRDAYKANGFPVQLRLSHFGLDIDRTPKPPSPDATQLRLGYMGQIARHKGVDLILRAMRQAAAPNLDLTIWGDMDQDPVYRRELTELAQGMRVWFAGRYPREDVARVLAAMDFAIVPSTWHENSPQSLLEALATHTPVIVSDVAGLTEFVVPERSGFVFPRSDVDGLAAVLRRLADDPERAAALTQTTDYPRTLKDMARDVVALYAEHGIEGAMAA